MLSIKPFHVITLLVILQSISRHCLCDDSDDSDDSSDTATATTTTAPPVTTSTTVAPLLCTICPCFGAQTDFSQCLNDDCQLSIDVISGVTILGCDDLGAIIYDGTGDTAPGGTQCILTDSENNIYEVHGPIAADQVQCCQDILGVLYTTAFEPAGCTSTTVTTTTPPPVTTSTTAASTTNDVPCTICPCFGAQTDFSQCLNDDCHVSITAGLTLMDCGDDLHAVISDGTASPESGCVLADSENNIYEVHGPIAADQVLCCQYILGVLYTTEFEPAGCTSSTTVTTTTTAPPVTSPSATLPEGGEECPCDWPEDITCGADANGCSYIEVVGGSSIICGTSSFVAANGFDCFENGDNSGSSSLGNEFEYNACRNALYGFAVSEGCTMLIS